MEETKEELCEEKKEEMKTTEQKVIVHAEVHNSDIDIPGVYKKDLEDVVNGSPFTQEKENFTQGSKPKRKVTCTVTSVTTESKKMESKSQRKMKSKYLLHLLYVKYKINFFKIFFLIFGHGRIMR